MTGHFFVAVRQPWGFSWDAWGLCLYDFSPSRAGVGRAQGVNVAEAWFIPSSETGSSVYEHFLSLYSGHICYWPRVNGWRNQLHCKGVCVGGVVSKSGPYRRLPSQRLRGGLEPGGGMGCSIVGPEPPTAFVMLGRLTRLSCPGRSCPVIPGE